MKVGLRIDVDTYRGTRLGVPALLEALAEAGIRATFFFSVGPDNMGRHLWRLSRPAFLRKMLRTRAARLYGWDVLWRGTLWPGPEIGLRLAPRIQSAQQAGHECGLHAWDHHAWQLAGDSPSARFLGRELERGFEALREILGSAPICSAAPGWRCGEKALLQKERLPFAFNSDCRGDRPFYPVVAGRRGTQLQIPVTLPTYDEAIGRAGVDDRGYNAWLVGQLRPDRLNVICAHAEVEGIVHRDMFRDFLATAQSRGAHFVPLGELVPERHAVELGHMVEREVPGREGPVACLA